MKRLLIGLMLLMTATAASAEWTRVGDTDEHIQFVDRATIRRNSNLVKMWDLAAYKTVRDTVGHPYWSRNNQREYDCKEEQVRTLAFTVFVGKMGDGKVVFTHSETEKWDPISPESVGETLWKIACGKK